VVLNKNGNFLGSRKMGANFLWGLIKINKRVALKLSIL